MSSANETAIEVVGGGKGDNFEVGKTYGVKLTSGLEFKGIVLAYDSVPHVVVFQEGTMPEAGKLMNTRLVNANFISKLTYMGKFKDPLASKKRLVDLRGLLDKEDIAISKIERIGVGVTAEAQSIFDALAQTFRVEWDKKDILVNGEVLICIPYYADCVTGGSVADRNQIKTLLRGLERSCKLSSGT